MDKIQFRRDTLARWAAANPILAEGEIGYVLDDPNRYKMGDGVKTWDQLPFRGFDGTIVHETGNDETVVMSQAAVTRELTELEPKSSQFVKLTQETFGSASGSISFGKTLKAGTTILLVSNEEDRYIESVSALGNVAVYTDGVGYDVAEGSKSIILTLEYDSDGLYVTFDKIASEQKPIEVYVLNNATVSSYHRLVSKKLNDQVTLYINACINTSAEIAYKQDSYLVLVDLSSVENANGIYVKAKNTIKSCNWYLDKALQTRDSFININENNALFLRREYNAIPQYAILKIDGLSADMQYDDIFNVLEILTETNICQYLVGKNKKIENFSDLVYLTSGMTVNENTGLLFPHTLQIGTPIYFVKGGEHWIIKKPTNLSIVVFFLSVDFKNDESVLSFLGSGDGETKSYMSVVIPENANAVRFRVQTHDGSSVTKEMLDEIEIKGDLYVYANPTEDKVRNVFAFDDNTSVCNVDKFIPYFGKTKPFDSITAIISKDYIKVKEGDSISFITSLSNKIGIVQVWEYITIGGDHTYTNIQNQDGFYKVKDGVNYIRILFSSVEGVTLDNINNKVLITLFRNNPYKGILSKDTIISTWNHSDSYAQGMAVHNGMVFQSFADGTIDVYDLNSKLIQERIKVPLSSDTEASAMHCNNITILSDGNLLIDSEEANTSMVLASCEFDNSGVAITKIQDIPVPAIDAELYKGSNQYIDDKNNILVQQMYYNVSGWNPGNTTSPDYGDLIIRVYSYDDLLNPTYTLIKEFVLPRCWAVQGGRLIGNYLYLMCGVSSRGLSCMLSINIHEGKICDAINLKDSCYNIVEEVQGFEKYKGKLYISTVKGLYIL